MDEFATLVYTEIRVREKDYKQAFEVWHSGREYNVKVNY